MNVYIYRKIVHSYMREIGLMCATINCHAKILLILQLDWDEHVCWSNAKTENCVFRI